MLGLNGKESERDDRFSATLPLDVEKVDTQKSSNPAQRKKSLITRSFERHRRLPLLSRIISILASIWIIFVSMRFIHQGFARRGKHKTGKHDWSDGPFEEPVPVDVTFNPTVQIGIEGTDSKTSLPLYIQPFQALDISWDQGTKGALSIQQDDYDLQRAYLVLQTSDDVTESSSVEAFNHWNRLSIRFRASEGEDVDEKIYNAILRVPSSFDVMPPLVIQGAEATISIPESMRQVMFPHLEIETLLSGFEADSLHVGLLRISSGTGDISGTFNVSQGLDLKTSTGNITAKVNLHKSAFPQPPHKPGRCHGHPEHGGSPGRRLTDGRPPSRFGKSWFWRSSEEDIEIANPYKDDEDIDESPVSLLPPPPQGHHGDRPFPPDHRRPPPPPGQRPPLFPPHDRRPPNHRRLPFPPGPDHHQHPGHPPLVRVHALSSTGNIHLTYLNHLEDAALVSSLYSDTGKVHVKLAEEYKGKFKAGVKVGQVVLANERDKTLVIDREVKTPTGAFVEGFVKSRNKTDGPRMSDELKGVGDERFAVEREFELARMSRDRAGLPPPFPFPHRPDEPRGRPGRHDHHQGPEERPHRQPHGPPDGPPKRRDPPYGHPHGPPPFHHSPSPGFGFSSAFSIVGEVKLTI
ncbi:hypothetical protein NCC49_004479 [Naganishia albida]|nr:hypothetical protein NCC49_004479 [Naganishia albida]